MTRHGLAVAMVAAMGVGWVQFGAAQQQNTDQQRQSGATQQRRDSARPQGTARSADMDKYFATCLVIDNQNEIALARIAKQKASSPRVKEFAAMLEKDHQEFLKKIGEHASDEVRNRRVDQVGEGRDRPGTRPAAGERRVDDVPNVDRPRAEGDAQARPQGAAAQRRPAGTPGAPGGTEAATRSGATLPAHALLSIKEEIADECLATARRELDQKDGEEFDHCYVGMQIALHMYMVDAMKVLERHASPELKSVISEGRETAEKHLEEAKEIIKNLEKGVETARKPTASESN